MHKLWRRSPQGSD